MPGYRVIMSIFPRPVTCPQCPASCHQMSASQRPPDTPLRRDQRAMLWHRSNVPADPTPPLLRSLICLLIARKKCFWRYWNSMFGTRLTSRYLCNSDIRSWTRLGTNPAPVSTCLWCPMSNANCENCGCWLQKQLAFISILKIFLGQKLVFMGEKVAKTRENQAIDIMWSWSVYFFWKYSPTTDRV